MNDGVPNPFGPGGMPLASPYLQRILRARVYDVAIESPLDAAPNLSRRLGNQVLLGMSCKPEGQATPQSQPASTPR